jgi:hypothetical protein
VKVEGQLPPDLNVSSQLSLFFEDSYVSLNFVDGVLEHDEFKQEQVCFHDECLPHSWMCRQCVYPTFRTSALRFAPLRWRIGIFFVLSFDDCNRGCRIGHAERGRPPRGGQARNSTQPVMKFARPAVHLASAQ